MLGENKNQVSWRQEGGGSCTTGRKSQHLCPSLRVDTSAWQTICKCQNHKYTNNIQNVPTTTFEIKLKCSWVDQSTLHIFQQVNINVINWEVCSSCFCLVVWKSKSLVIYKRKANFKIYFDLFTCPQTLLWSRQTWNCSVPWWSRFWWESWWIVTGVTIMIAMIKFTDMVMVNVQNYF